MTNHNTECPAPWIPPEDFTFTGPKLNEVWLGSEKNHFIRGHVLSVADLLDALDGHTERVFMAETHVLILSREGERSEYSDPNLEIALEDGDLFEAVAREDRS